jgi:cytidylate kinase
MKFNVAIDGPSSAGKSTIANAIADKYQLTHIDTGAMYRCLAIMIERLDINPDDELEIEDILPSVNIHFDDIGHIYLNDEDVTDLIRNDKISWYASTVSKHFAVRRFLVEQQQQISQEKGFVLDGRDIGTVVLPNAEVKLFITADAASRARRRYLEYKDKGIECNYNDVYQDILKRDYQDSNRENSPLIKADDAIEIDTSDLTIEEVLIEIDHIIDSKLKGEEVHD